MRPVPVKEILQCGKRLGINEIIAPDLSGAVSHLIRYEEGEYRQRLFAAAPAILLLPQAGKGEAHGSIGQSPVPETLFRNIACLSLSAEKIPVSLLEFSERTGTPVFSSSYDEFLLHSRLTGLLREKGERLTMVHAVLVRVSGFGVLILGKSAIGKTRLGLALMEKKGCWVADDAVVLEGRGESVYGRGHWRTEAAIALRGRGISRVGDLFGEARRVRETRVDLIVRLVQPGSRDAMARAVSRQEFVGVSLPCVDIEADPDPSRVADQVPHFIRALAVRDSGGAADGDLRRMERPFPGAPTPSPPWQA